MKMIVSAESTKPSPKTGCASAPNAKVETVIFADIHCIRSEGWHLSRPLEHGAPVSGCEGGSYQSPDLAHTRIGPFIRKHSLDSSLFNAKPSGQFQGSREEAALLITGLCCSRTGMNHFGLDREVLFLRTSPSPFHVCI